MGAGDKINQNDQQQGKLDQVGAITPERPQGWSRALAYLYPAILAVLAVLDVVLLIRVWRRLPKRAFFLTVIIAAPVGWAWNILMMNFDPNAAAWLFHPWGYSGVFFLQSLEDWLFYPVCGVFFIMVCELVPVRPVPGPFDRDLRHWITVVNISLCTFPAVWFAPAGWSEIVFFGLPGTVLLWGVRFNPRHYLTCCTIFIIFACLWDLVAVTWLRQVWPWAEQWFYVSFDVFGRAHQSAVFLSWGTPGGWIGRSPVEITPFFSIYGSIFIYGLYYRLKI